MRHNWNNITMIGMPASGKSTVGVLLAKRIGYQFIDSDILIQNQEKRSGTNAPASLARMPGMASAGQLNA